MSTTKNFSESYRQFGQAISKTFASHFIGDGTEFG
jgi:hypothetical protein